MSKVREEGTPERAEDIHDGSRDEVLSNNERTRVFRRVTAGGDSIICKEPLGPDAVARLRHETSMLRRLAGVAGVPQLAATPQPEHLIALEDKGCVPLVSRLNGQHTEIRPLLELFLALARIVAAIHRRGIVHKNITPANLLVCGPDKQPMLTDFEFASTVAEERPGFTHHSDVAGTLAYLSPEQTGRTGRAVDQRTDLYSLGATFYELATGRLPFEGSDPLQLIHDHLARLPAAPLDLNPRLPRGLSNIILHLLEKEPDRRYQSAEGLEHDLSCLIEALVRGEDELPRLGERDFPLRLSAPSKLVGREAELAALQASFDNALTSRGRGVLVSGAPGIGKTSLINELRPIVTAKRGWFVSGKFDQYRHDAASAAVQALRALGRLLLAEPEAELATQRELILRALGPNAGLVTALLPEFELLLGPQPEVISNDPVEAEARQRLAMLELLRAVASPARPVVMFLDDLQWASVVSIRFIDSVLMDDALRNLLLVGAYRDGEVPATHPLSAMLSRWQWLGEPPLQLRLGNLPPPDLGAMLSAMLRLPASQAAQAARLAEAVGARTGGNPYDTVELVNALRRDGALVPGAEGWGWDEATIRRYVGQGDVVDLLATRIAKLPRHSERILEVMACLGGELEFGLIEAASGISRAALEDQLAPPLEDGLLVMEHDGAVRFRHDRVQQAAYGRLSASGRLALHLALARRLAGLPGRETEAAEQYLPAVENIAEPAERRRVVGLFRAAAAQARLASNYTTVERFLAAAVGLLCSDGTAADDETRQLLIELETGRHAALYNLGRLDDADGVYHAIERRCSDPQDLAAASCVQLDSLCNRGRQRQAVALGMNLLQRLGLTVPGEDARAEVAQRLDGLYRWVEEHAHGDPRQQHQMDDARLIAIARVLNRLLAPAFFCDPTVTAAWVVLESHRLWTEHGSCAPLVATTSMVSPTVIALRQDYRTGYVAARHTVVVSEACGYQPDTSWARHIFTLFSQHWFEPLEDSLGQARMAREGLLQGGDLQFACYTYYNSLASLLDCAPTLGSCAAEADTALAFAARTGNGHATGTFLSYRQLMRAMRGETVAPGSFNDASFDEARHLASLATNPMAAGVFHTLRAVSAAIFGKAWAVQQHTAKAMELMPYIEGFYLTSLAYALQALDLAQRARSAAPDAVPAMLAELNDRRTWLARRAADAPMNFEHLLKLVDAELAWAEGEDWRAARTYEEALSEPHPRPWQRAFIAERAGQFHLARGLEHTGRQLLAEARQLYGAWGATAKVQQLEQAYPYLRAATRSRGLDPRQHSIVSAEAMDMVAILRASQALSSETSLGRLTAQVVEVLGAMTGATSVSLILWQEEAKEWAMLPTGGEQETPLPLAEAGRRGLLPLSVFRYAERTREPLLVEDATRDDRFARDPYFGSLEHCSLMLVPILHHGGLRAMLQLENRLSRSIFSADRLDAVLLITGQLAVSLENALLYEQLEERVRERTRELRDAQTELVATARQAGMAEVAINVLHNVGNVLNSVNISAGLVSSKIRHSRLSGLARAVELMDAHAQSLGEFLTSDERGKLLPGYLGKLAHTLAEEQQSVVEELDQLTHRVDHIKDIVATQQSYAVASAMVEPVLAADLVEDALRMNAGALTRHDVHVIREFAAVPLLPLDKARILQILVNLISNAKHALTTVSGRTRRMTLRIGLEDGSRLRISVEDNGEGIPAENLTRIFSHGFTTRKDGHGFGLHSCALAARAMGGTLTVHSDGPGTGALFTLELPVEAATGSTS